MDPTINTDADRCRANGWRIGDYLASDEGHGPTTIQITAIGEEHILARETWHDGKPVDGAETNWTLRDRDWRKIQ